MLDEITFSDLIGRLKFLLSIVLKKWYVILLISMVGAVVGAYYAYTIKPKYQADLTFIVEDDDRTNSSGLLGLASQFGLNIGQSSDAFSTKNMTTILKSTKIVISTLLSVGEIDGRKDRLLNFYLEISGMRQGFLKNDQLKTLSYPLNQNQETFSRLQDSILLLVSDQITKNVIDVEKTDDKSDLFKMICITNDESFSILFANQIIKKTSDFYTETKTKRSLEVVNLLQKRTDSIKTEYNLALIGRAASADQNVNPAFQLPLVNIQRRQTDITILATAYGELVKNLEIAKFNLLKETPLVQIIDSPQAPIKKIKPGRLLYGLLCAFLFGLIATINISFKAVKKIKIKQANVN